MTGDRLPFQELLTAILTRLAADVTAIRFYTFVPQDQKRPYGEVTDFSSEETQLVQSSELAACDFHIYSNGPSPEECFSLMGAALTSLTKEKLALANSWRVEWHKREGRAEAFKEMDESGIYWRGTFRVAWKLTNEIGGD